MFGRNLTGKYVRIERYGMENVIGKLVAKDRLQYVVRTFAPGSYMTYAAIVRVPVADVRNVVLGTTAY